MCAERGYEHVRLEDIAARAGVSSRTLFRYFPTREDLFVESDEALVVALGAALEGRPAGATPFDVVRSFARSLADYYVERREFCVARHALIVATPALARRGAGYRPAFVDSLTELFAGSSQLDVGGRRRLHVAMGALRGATDVALYDWLDGGGNGSLHAAWQEAIDVVAPALEPLLSGRSDDM